uniref:DNA-directed RNA polymerase subunit n=1 Tax=Jakoba bahamiensis TaxID=221721 RepID=M4QD86_9EUKA|nr:RNA polymerase subunit beta' [Jakoba bahamiensis]AGH24145.1 RNA polymerase subunit beta' [Jakoba bahamiensis]
MQTSSNFSPSNEKALILSFLNPKRVLLDSGGEVLSADTISLKKSEFHHLGLFSTEIFGPISSFDRRRKIGHVKLNSVIPHPWYLKFKWLFAITNVYDRVYTRKNKKSNQNILATAKHERYPLMHEMMEELLLHSDYYYKELCEIDLVSYYYLLKKKQCLLLQQISTQKEYQAQLLEKRKLEILLSCIVSGQHPSWMFLTILPVLPPDLRPVLQLSPGLFISSEMNHLYKKILRLNTLLGELSIVSKIRDDFPHREDRLVEQTKLELKYAVYELLDGKGSLGYFDRLLRNSKSFGGQKQSLVERLHGKEGRFRHDVLGKRVNYSGRSVISSGPRMRFNECGIPFELFYKIFKGFFYYKFWNFKRLSFFSYDTRNSNVRQDLFDTQFYLLIERYLKQHPVLLNRAPTLHKYNIQAFYPRLVTGRSVLLHPLVCSSFNADFDGDTMAIHFPMTLETQIESRLLMHSSFNIVSQSSNTMMISPSQDVVFGIYYLTSSPVDNYADRFIEEIRDLNQIKVGLIHGIFSIFDRIVYKKTLMTVGQLLFFELILSHLSIKAESDLSVWLSLISKTIVKKELHLILQQLYYYLDSKTYSYFLDQIMSLGFYYTYKSGLSIHKNDINVPSLKKLYIKRAQRKLLQDFVITSSVRGHSNTLRTDTGFVNIWMDCLNLLNSQIVQDIVKTSNLSKPSIYMLVDSGARGSMLQIQQLAGMRGFMVKASGDLLRYPILSNFKEGLSPIEYYNSIYGSRKGVIDTSLKTATSGYLTRKLVYSSKDVFIAEEDCGTSQGILCSISDSPSSESFYQRLIGRVVSKQVNHPITGELLLRKDTLLSENHVKLLKSLYIGFVFLRSPFLCEHEGYSVCQKCYGSRDDTSELVHLDDAVGLVAAQSIGEPGTQLTMRTFHQGGAASKKKSLNEIVSDSSYKLMFINERLIYSEKDFNVSYCVSRSMKVAFYPIHSHNLSIETSYSPHKIVTIPYGAKLFVLDGQVVEKGDLISWWTSTEYPIVSPIGGIVLIESFTFEQYSEKSGSFYLLKIISDLGEFVYFALKDDILCVSSGQYVSEGHILMYISKIDGDSQDITGGLTKISKLFEIVENRSGQVVPFDSHFILKCESIGNERSKPFCSLEPVVSLQVGKKSRSFGYLLEQLSQDSSRFLTRGNEYLIQGDRLTIGNFPIRQTIECLGLVGIRQYIQEIMQTYLENGVLLREIHFELIIRTMLFHQSFSWKWLKLHPFERRRVISSSLLGLNEDRVKLSLLGVTSSGLLSSSFFSAASFQRMSVILSKSAVLGGFEVVSESVQSGLFIGIPFSVGTGGKLLNISY